MKERDLRTIPRIQLKKALSKYLFLDRSKNRISCFSRDVSQRGLGIISRTQFKDNQVIDFRFPGLNHCIKLAVTHSTQLSSRQVPLFHTGLKTLTPHDNLLECMQLEGLVDSVPSHELPGLKPNVNLSFHDIQTILKLVRMEDPKFLKKVGLTKLSLSHIAYPISFRDQILVALLPRQFSVQKLLDSERYLCLQSISVLTQSAPSSINSWTKVWPTQKDMDQMAPLIWDEDFEVDLFA